MAATGSHAQRVARLRGLMAESGVDALIVFENGQTRYLTGYQRYFTGSSVAPVHAALLTAHAGPVLLKPRHIVTGEDEHAAERLVDMPFAEDERVALIASLLRDLGATGRVALERDFLPAGTWARLEAGLGAEAIVDGSALFRQATAVKFTDEVDLLREAARQVDIGAAAAIAACRPGATELQVAARASAAMLEAGAEFINHMTIRSGPHAWGNYPVPTARALRDGDCVQIDLGSIHRGYVSDTNRTVVVGTPTDAQEALLRTGEAMLAAGVAAVRPGVKAAHVWDACFAVARAAGMGELVVLPYAGHGIGLSLHEHPFVNGASDSVLEAGMVFALEPGVYAEGIGCSRPEDMILVTPSGCERLTHHPRDHEILQGRSA